MTMVDEKKPGHVFVVGGGKVRTLYTDEMPLKALGVVATKRASHVDGSADLNARALVWLWDNRRELWPCFAPFAPVNAWMRSQLDQSQWWADLLPSNGPVLGPFETRQAALDAEVAWLRVYAFNVVD